MITCCKDCEERSINCHSICQEYKDQKILDDKLNADIRIKKFNNGSVNGNRLSPSKYR